MISKLNKIIIIFSLLILGGCSFYSFKGSIPGHIKSVYIAPIDNTTMESSVSDIIKFELELPYEITMVSQLSGYDLYYYNFFDHNFPDDIDIPNFDDLSLEHLMFNELPLLTSKALHHS